MLPVDIAREGMAFSYQFSLQRSNKILQPVEALSKERPQNNIFNPYIIGSVLGQFAIHIGTLLWLSNYVARLEP